MSPNGRFLCALTASLVFHLALLAVPTQSCCSGAFATKWVGDPIHLSWRVIERDMAIPVEPIPQGRKRESRLAQTVLPPGSANPSRYLSSREIDQSAQLLGAPRIVMPESAYKERIRGRVVLAILISPNGTVDGIEIIDSWPTGIYDEVVVAAALKARYRPAQLFGRPVPSRKVVEFELDPYETIGRP